MSRAVSPAQHTPGPVYLVLDRGREAYRGSDYRHAHAAWSAINGRRGTAPRIVVEPSPLIAAAPDLLAALEELVAEHDEDAKAHPHGLNDTGGMEQARAAIAAARGVTA